MNKILRSVIKYSVLLVVAFTIGCSISNSVARIRTNSYFNSIEADHTYVINKEIDLQGRCLKLLDNDTLLFKGGMFKNGEIEGKNTVILGGKQLLFENVELSGTWNNDIVYSDWLEFRTDSLYDNRGCFVNLMALCKSLNYTTVYLKGGNYWTSVKKGGSAISIPSNTHFIFKGTIYELPNNYERASLIKLYHVENVIIDGGIYLGDVEHHRGTTGEWSHGISIWGSSDVTIKGVECNYFWGDGIDLIEAFDNHEKPAFNCKNIVVDGCSCRYNRRQGLSVESGYDCIIRNSDFSYTGKLKYTPPAAGIDIEAWATNNEKIKNIRIENCTMFDNVGYSIQSYSNAVLGDSYRQYSNDIVVENCVMDNTLINRTNAIRFVKCKIKSKPIEKKSNLVEFIDCTIKEK